MGMPSFRNRLVFHVEKAKLLNVETASRVASSKYVDDNAAPEYFAVEKAFAPPLSQQNGQYSRTGPPCSPQHARILRQNAHAP